MKKLIRSSSNVIMNQVSDESISEFIAEVTPYLNTSVESYARMVLDDLDEHLQRFDEDKILRELSILDVCYNVVENVKEVTGICPKVSYIDTIMLPSMNGVIKYLTGWKYDVLSASIEHLIEDFTNKWISTYRKCLKFDYKSRYSAEINPSEYVDIVLHEEKELILPGAIITNESVAEQFIITTVKATYQRNRTYYS